MLKLLNLINPSEQVSSSILNKYDNELIAGIKFNKLPPLLESLQIQFTKENKVNIDLELFTREDLNTMLAEEIDSMHQSILRHSKELTGDAYFAMFSTYHSTSRLSKFISQSILADKMYRPLVLKYEQGISIQELYYDMFWMEVGPKLTDLEESHQYDDYSVEKFRQVIENYNTTPELIKSIKVELPLQSDDNLPLIQEIFVTRHNLAKFESSKFERNENYLVTGSLEALRNPIFTQFLSEYSSFILGRKQLRALNLIVNSQDDLVYDDLLLMQPNAEYNPILNKALMLTQDKLTTSKFDEKLQAVQRAKLASLVRLPSITIKYLSNFIKNIEYIIEANTNRPTFFDFKRELTYVDGYSANDAAEKIHQHICDLYNEQRRETQAGAHDSIYITKEVRLELCKNRYNLKKAVQRYEVNPFLPDIIVDYRLSSQLLNSLKVILENVMKVDYTASKPEHQSSDYHSLMYEYKFYNFVQEVESAILKHSMMIKDPVNSVLVNSNLELPIPVKEQAPDETASLEEIIEFSKKSRITITTTKDNVYDYVLKFIESDNVGKGPFTSILLRYLSDF